MENVYTFSQIKNLLTPIFIQTGVSSAVLFGSYGKGQATEKSDVDLLVNSGMKGFQFTELMEKIATALNKKVDLLDVSHIEPNSPIEKEIKATGITVYEK